MPDPASRRPFRLPIDVTDDGGARHVEVNGQTYDIAQDGTVRAKLDRLQKIAIGNVLELRNYHINSMDGRTMHVFEFVNGGNGEITFTADGQLEVFELFNLAALVSTDGRTVTIGCQLVETASEA